MFDWSLAEGAPVGRRFILAGGLTPENVAEAIERVRPWGVDVSTGVESSPGRKDPMKVRDFIRNARAAEPAGYHGDEDARALRLGRGAVSALTGCSPSRDLCRPMAVTDGVMGDPDADGRFGRFGGRFVPETLVPACEELEAAFVEAWADPAFRGRARRAAARLRRPAVDPHRVPPPRRRARAAACC